jgi:hypothetical protein
MLSLEMQLKTALASAAQFSSKRKNPENFCALKLKKRAEINQPASL